MIERSIERRALPREVVNVPALLSFDGITGVHPCVVRDINAFGACLSSPYYIFASEFELLFSGFHKTLACRVVWRRATLSGVVFVVRRRLPKPESASINQLNLPNALLPMRPVGDVCVLPFDMH
ncbi:PilZ domain-containing protein [Bradyrhizobium japonicum]|uniref:PilZ domain-containing protein n=1 Tax=Bradyrhizobium japonicum TaxID=375 RepID=UPI00271504B5|nr:PilZ domain-containing protein [Bradyrhizobium japonicum]WLB23989.1 PilZ domain-containing protein [Bradyrhizobium japonicum]